MMDVGGTFIKSGLMTSDGILKDGSQQTSPIDSDGTKDDICKSLTSVVSQGLALCRESGCKPAGIGICMPGPFDYARGISRMVHKFASIKDIPLKEVIRSAMSGHDIPIIFGHDVNVQLYGEMCGGNAVGFDNVCLVSLGTGLGFALAADGKILHTPAGTPMVSIWNKPYKEGILEDYASKRGFSTTWEEVTGKRPAKELTVARMGELAEAGNKEALEVFRRIGHIIGANIREKLAEYKIRCLLFGGQISRSFRFMEDAVRKELDGLENLHIDTVSDFSNAAFKGLLEMLKLPQSSL